MRWSSSNFYPNKYGNLYGCALNVSNIGGLKKVRKAIISNLKLLCSSEVIVALATTSNFQINTKIFASKEEALRSTTSDLHAFQLIMTEYNDIHAVMSACYNFDNAVLLIPPGELYTPLEKLFLMFELEVWIWIAVTLLTALRTIQIVNLAPRKIQRFIYGRMVTTPTLNVFSTFLIGNQTVIPGRNFARYLLMLFIIWSLIIRTCHQSVLFKYLQQDLRKPEIQTIREIFERGFTI